MESQGTSETKIMIPNNRKEFYISGRPSVTSLQAPVVRIGNHKSEVLSCDFHPSGKYIVSANRMGEVQLSDIYGGFPNSMVLKGHTGPVMQTTFSGDGFDIYSCSTDESVIIWDTFMGQKKATLGGHRGSVNCIDKNKTGYPVICSGSNDGTMKLWDTREKNCTLTLERGTSITSVCFSESVDYVFSSSLDNDIEIWDIRRKDILYTLKGHSGTVTGVSLSPCAQYLLSHSVDQSLRIWDIRPFVKPSKREKQCFRANQMDVCNLLRCAWSSCGTMVSAGTGGRDVSILDANNGAVLHEFSGHKMAINDVAFHPNENIILSVSNDSYMYLNEI